MELSQQQIKLIKQSWRSFRNVSPEAVGDLFYSKLFADHPSIRKMFPKDMREQYKKLVDMLTAIIVRIDNIGLLTDEITAMANRHLEYGVKPTHYKIIGDALLWTLEKGLKSDWNEEVKEAWTICYTILATTMINASTNQQQIAHEI
jgi:hemoglobin-like flavoprotein